MATKPDVAALVAWQNAPSPSEGVTAVLTECLTAAIDDIESRCDLPAGTTDEDYPQRLRTAELLLASRLAKRSSSPEGVAGISDIGAVVRIMGTDPDIERLILRYLKVDGFA